MNTLRALFLLASLCLTACAQTTATQGPTSAPVAERATSVIESTIALATTIASPTSLPSATAPPLATISATPSPISATVPSQATDCAVLPEGSFLTIWQNDSDLHTSLGCPTSHHPRITPIAWEVKTSYQAFENGTMLWSDHIGWYEQAVVYVIYANGSYERFDDTFDPAVDPVNAGEQAPNERVAPSYGFGKLWREQAHVRDALGWATAGEIAGGGRFQLFNGGDMLWLDQTAQVYAFSRGVVHTFDFPSFE